MDFVYLWEFTDRLMTQIALYRSFNSYTGSRIDHQQASLYKYQILVDSALMIIFNYLLLSLISFFTFVRAHWGNASFVEETTDSRRNVRLCIKSWKNLGFGFGGRWGKKSLQECGAYEICREWARKHAENAGLILHRWGQTEQLL